MTNIDTKQRNEFGPTATQRSAAQSSSQSLDSSGNASPDDQARHLRIILEAVAKSVTIRLVFNGHERIIAPHRVWRQADGSVLIEVFQLAGGSAWAGMDGSGFTPSEISGWQGWINIPLEKITRIIEGGDPFVPHRDFNPNPKRRLGIIEAQVKTRGARP